MHYTPTSPTRTNHPPPRRVDFFFCGKNFEGSGVPASGPLYSPGDRAHVLCELARPTSKQQASAYLLNKQRRPQRGQLLHPQKPHETYGETICNPKSVPDSKKREYDIPGPPLGTPPQHNTDRRRPSFSEVYTHQPSATTKG